MDKIKQYYQKYKSEIIVGVVVTIITSFISNLGNWFFSTAPTLGSSVQDSLTNIIYSLAATQTNNSILIFIYFCFISFIFASMLIALINSFSAIKKASKFNKLLNTTSSDKNESLELSLKETNEAQHTTVKTDKDLMRYIKLSKN